MAAKKSYGITTPDFSAIKSDIKPFKLNGVQFDYDRLLCDALYYVHYEIAVKTLASEFIKYCALNYSKTQAQTLTALRDHHFGTFGKYAYVANRGTELPEHYVNALRTAYEQLLVQAQQQKQQAMEQSASDCVQPALTIQQRMKQQLTDLMAEFDGMLDCILRGTATLAEFNPELLMKTYHTEVKPAHAKMINDAYSSELEQARLVLQWTDPEIKEAYSHLNTAKLRKTYAQFFELIHSACNTVINKRQATRKTRTPKTHSKQKLVSKLKYKSADSTLALASIDPVSIIGATKLWVYNTHNRKLGCYIADEYLGPLTVKGTSVVGFCEMKSTQKTVRKPETCLKGAGTLARTKLDKLYVDLTTTETKLTGRINEHTVLIRAF